MEKVTRIDIKKLIVLLTQISEGSLYCNITVNGELNDMLVEAVLDKYLPPSTGLTLNEIEGLFD